MLIGLIKQTIAIRTICKVGLLACWHYRAVLLFQLYRNNLLVSMIYHFMMKPHAWFQILKIWKRGVFLPHSSAVRRAKVSNRSRLRVLGCFQAAYLALAGLKGVYLLMEFRGVTEFAAELLRFLVGVLPEAGTKPSSTNNWMKVSGLASKCTLGICTEVKLTETFLVDSTRHETPGIISRYLPYL